ncbi:MAG TPA: hypothetical protein VJM12_14485 [Pyrinomonadaceae bacterium]|nr:hypothetical protein [Pyrinomonadaceae bacterium]
MEWLLKVLGGLSGLSLVGILAFAFWLGSVNARVTASSETITRVFGAVAENKDSLLVRTSVIEHRLGNVEKRLDSVEVKLDSLEKKTDNLETRLVSVQSKLDKLIELHGRR